MNDQTFISIGTKGTDIPQGLKRIEPPLVVGVNKLRWNGLGKVEVAALAHGWVLKLVEPFEVYPLEQAIREGRVVHVPQIKWRASVNGSIHEGEAFFRAPWAKCGSRISPTLATSGSLQPGHTMPGLRPPGVELVGVDQLLTAQGVGDAHGVLEKKLFVLHKA